MRSWQSLGRAGMRLSQYLSGALAIFWGLRGNGICARQDDAISPEYFQAAGGIRALAAEIAEDAAFTKLVRKNGLRVRMVDRPFLQPLGHRTAAEVWRRQLRWARLRRDTFVAYFVPEIGAGVVPPLVSGAVVAVCNDWPVAGALAAFGATPRRFWPTLPAGIFRGDRRSYGCSAMLCSRCCGRQAGWGTSSCGAAIRCVSSTAAPPCRRH